MSVRDYHEDPHVLDSMHVESKRVVDFKDGESVMKLAGLESQDDFLFFVKFVSNKI